MVSQCVSRGVWWECVLGVWWECVVGSVVGVCRSVSV